MLRRLFMLALSLALVGLVGGGISPVLAEDEPDVEAKPNTFTDGVPRSGLYFNNPTTDNKAVSELIVRRIKGAAPGSLIRIQTWSFTDEAVADALEHAIDDDNVNVRLITGHANCDDMRTFLNAQDVNLNNPGSWFRCVSLDKDHPRGSHGMHQKTLLFTNSNGVKVTLVGSSNLASANWSQQWNDMYQFAGNETVYNWYLDRFTAIADHTNDPWNVKYHEVGNDDFRAKFLPIDNDASEARDPIIDRLNDLPAKVDGHPTFIDIAMYGMDKPRGDWIVAKLRAMQRNGAIIYFLAGPEVKDALIEDLIAPGEGRIAVTRGYRAWSEADTEWKEFVHLKMMTARYWEGTNYARRSYTGSENWSMEGLTRNFEVEQRISGPKTYTAYSELFNDAWNCYFTGQPPVSRDALKNSTRYPLKRCPVVG